MGNCWDEQDIRRLQTPTDQTAIAKAMAAGVRQTIKPKTRKPKQHKRTGKIEVAFVGDGPPVVTYYHYWPNTWTYGDDRYVDHKQWKATAAGWKRIRRHLEAELTSGAELTLTDTGYILEHMAYTYDLRDDEDFYLEPDSETEPDSE